MLVVASCWGAPWAHNDDLDLYKSIDLIKGYYDIMTDSLRC
jgi:hypothetical protein